MTKYEIPDDHVWADEKEPTTKESKPVFEIQHHLLEILHREGGQRKERDKRYHFAFDGGQIFAIGKEHRLADSNQFDPIGNVSWNEVPNGVKRKLAEAMNQDPEQLIDNERITDMASWDK